MAIATFCKDLKGPNLTAWYESFCHVALEEKLTCKLRTASCRDTFVGDSNPDCLYKCFRQQNESPFVVLQHKDFLIVFSFSYFKYCISAFIYFFKSEESALRSFLAFSFLTLFTWLQSRFCNALFSIVLISTRNHLICSSRAYMWTKGQLSFQIHASPILQYRKMY